MNLIKSLLRVSMVTIAVVGCSCGRSDSQTDAGQAQYVIGFNNMFTQIEFFRMVERTLEEAAAQHGVKLLKAYGQRDAQRVRSNIETFLVQGADLVMDLNVLPEVGDLIAASLNDEGIPMIGIDCEYEGAYFFGINNEEVGRTAGAFTAEWIKENWNGRLDYVVHLYSEDAGPVVKRRNSAASEVIQEKLPAFQPRNTAWLDGGTQLDAMKARTMAIDFLTARPMARHIYFHCHTEDAAMGVVAALETANRMQHAMVVSCDAGSAARRNLRGTPNAWRGAVAAFPERYGEYLIAYALDILEGRNPPRQRYVENEVMTRFNLDQYYPE